MDHMMGVHMISDHVTGYNVITDHVNKEKMKVKKICHEAFVTPSMRGTMVRMCVPYVDMYHSTQAWMILSEAQGPGIPRKADVDGSRAS